ncbi:hypothetical protein [Noviherbaspirillum aerium]|uniref:hypothetical protein n=1 Tax=Noviherbaspirillum aerium TaxID=2588497 RepID=UPI00124C9686|nr:hypothetical protein [Noviherbaspirillum aerium]
MLNFQSPLFLRRVLLADAAAGAATGLLMLSGAGMLESLLNLPAALLKTAGASLLPLAAFLVWLGTRKAPSRTAVWIVIAVNAVWVVESFYLLLSGWVAPNALGQAFIVAQALAVAVLAELEYFGLRRSPSAVAC